MSIKRKSNGKWLVDTQPGGRSGKRFRKIFQTYEEAKAWNAWITTQVIKNSDWMPLKKDERPMSDLADIWYKNYGIQLKSGKDTFNRIKSALKEMGNPTAYAFTTAKFIDYRSKRLASGLSLGTANREHAYFRAIINELKRLGYWQSDNPLNSIRKFKEKENELSYLTFEQIDSLFMELNRSQNEDTQLIAKICLATGARWGEAQNLTINRVSNQKVQYTDTKSGKNRTIPITKNLQLEIERQAEKNIGKKKLFKNSYSAFRRAIERTDIKLPAGQLTHVLRHTFASHFMMAGGNILVLQRALGHKDLKTTMRYAHLAPDHLEAVKKLNPLSLSSLC